MWHLSLHDFHECYCVFIFQALGVHDHSGDDHDHDHDHDGDGIVIEGKNHKSTMIDTVKINIFGFASLGSRRLLLAGGLGNLDLKFQKIITTPLSRCTKNCNPFPDLPTFKSSIWSYQDDIISFTNKEWGSGISPSPCGAT